jgi:hypothetical protein
MVEEYVETKSSDISEPETEKLNKCSTNVTNLGFVRGRNRIKENAQKQSP